MLQHLIVALFVMAAPTASAPSAAVDRAPPDRPPSDMTSTEIKAYNEGLAMTHPFYIKCKRVAESGSWVKKARVCRTNEQWKDAWVQGNQNARDTADAMTGKAIDCRATGSC